MIKCCKKCNASFAEIWNGSNYEVRWTKIICLRCKTTEETLKRGIKYL